MACREGSFYFFQSTFDSLREKENAPVYAENLLIKRKAYQISRNSKLEPVRFRLQRITVERM